MDNHQHVVTKCSLFIAVHLLHSVVGVTSFNLFTFVLWSPLPLHTYLESHGTVLFFTLRNVCKWLSFSADDDSEPILGLWFEETISPTKDKVAPPPPPPPPPLETSPRLKSPSKQNPSENGNILAGRKDPELVRSEFCVAYLLIYLYEQLMDVFNSTTSYFFFL